MKLPILTLALVSTVYADPFFNAQPTSTPASYLYSPGLMTSEVAMGRYCPDFTASTGEQVTWKNAGHTIGELHSAVNFPDVSLRTRHFTINPLAIFVNNIKQDLFPLLRRFAEDYLCLSVKAGPDTTRSVVDFNVNFCNANIGQKKDIKALQKNYKAHVKKFPNTDIVMYGDSRGAATTFNFIAQHKPAHVKAAVLEGIFDDVQHAVKHFLYTDKTEREEKRLFSLLRMFCRGFKKYGITPRKMAEVITDDVPLLFVLSLKDNFVEPQGGIWLYNRLRERGHKKVHILILQEAFHPAYMLQPEDKQVYEATVHAFYKHYNLPYNAEQAAAGLESFNACQPSAEELIERYELPLCDRCCCHSAP